MGQKVYLAATVLIALALIGTTAYLFFYEPPTTTIQILPPAPTPTDLPTATPAPLEVYVTGAVLTPQARLTLPYGSRVEDAIEAAGGTTEDALLDAVNLAQLLRDGDQIHVPSISTPTNETAPPTVALPTPNTNNPTTAPVAAPSSSASGLINLNTATLEELDTLPEIGLVMAQRIIDYRTQNGPFQSVDDLLNVSGIGDATLQKLRPLVTVN